MRETWIPFFQDIRNSSVWAYDAETFKVWMALLTMVDPEGFICAAIPGIAIAANIRVEKVREAIALFEGPDLDSRSQAHEGRRLQRVPRGWLMLNLEEHRERARREADKARKRRWARAHRVAAVDAVSTPRSETVDASKSKSKSIPPKKEGSPLPPEAHDAMGFVDGFDAGAAQALPVLAPGDGLRPLLWEPPAPPEPAQASPMVWFTLLGWEPPPELRSEATLAGIPPEAFDARVAELRAGPIGGKRGVLDRDGYVRNQIPKWRKWLEEEGYREQAARTRRGRVEPPPEPVRPRRKERDHAVRFGYDIDAIFDAVNAEGWVARVGAEDARREARRRMEAAARSRKGMPSGAVP